jgi:hypothetical protein
METNSCWLLFGKKTRKNLLQLKVFKYKMHCRLEKTDEKEYEIRIHAQLSLAY